MFAIIYCKNISCLQKYFVKYNKGCKGNDTADFVKSIKLGIVVSYKILIRNFEREP